jgi:hypothetical protein
MSMIVVPLIKIPDTTPNHIVKQLYKNGFKIIFICD